MAPPDDEGRRAINFHASAVVLGTTGLLIMGPPGSGKSHAAFTLVAEARAAGFFAAPIADDQVWLTFHHGRTLASRPTAIAGLLELRGSGIVTVPSIPEAVVSLVVAPAEPVGAGRLPEVDEAADLPTGTRLPLFRLDLKAPAPLARLAALHPRLLHN